MHFSSFEDSGGKPHLIYEGSLLEYQTNPDSNRTRGYLRFDFVFENDSGQINDFLKMVLPEQEIQELNNAPSLIVDKFKTERK